MPGWLAHHLVRLTWGALVLAYAGWATGLPVLSIASTAAVLGAGMIAFAVGLHLPRRRHSSEVAVAVLVVWLLPLAALAAWQLIAFTQTPRAEHPTLSSLANTLLDVRPVRALALAAWLVGAANLAR